MPRLIRPLLLLSLLWCWMSVLSGAALSLSSPTCALNGIACPSPQWAPQWNLTLSTICQPGGIDDFFLPNVSQPWGLISLDWSVATKVWMKPNQSESTCEQTSIQNCRLIKQRFPQTRCFIYHNLELALQCFTTQRAVMYDPARAHYFVQYTDGQGRKNGTIYNEPSGAGGPGDQYFWDFRRFEVRDYYVSSVLSTTADDAVDGTFTDDVAGFPLEHDSGPAHVNMSATEVTELQYWTQLTHASLVDALVTAGKYNWQAFGGAALDFVGPGVTAATCAAFLGPRCSAAFQQQAFTMQFDAANPTQSIAAFLLVRGPTAYIGYGVESDQRQWHKSFLLQVGEPQTDCIDAGSGVFIRGWTHGIVTLDCNTFSATLPHASGVENTANTTSRSHTLVTTQ